VQWPTIIWIWLSFWDVTPCSVVESYLRFRTDRILDTLLPDYSASHLRRLRPYGFIWRRNRNQWQVLWALYWTFWSHKMLWISWSA